jgi:hypothetical protein
LNSLTSSMYKRFTLTLHQVMQGRHEANHEAVALVARQRSGSAVLCLK